MKIMETSPQVTQILTHTDEDLNSAIRRLLPKSDGKFTSANQRKAVKLALKKTEISWLY